MGNPSPSFFHMLTEAQKVFTDHTILVVDSEKTLPLLESLCLVYGARSVITHTSVPENIPTLSMIHGISLVIIHSLCEAEEQRVQCVLQTQPDIPVIIVKNEVNTDWKTAMNERLKQNGAFFIKKTGLYISDIANTYGEQLRRKRA